MSKEPIAWEFSRLSALLDESLDMAPGERDVWLSELAGIDPTSASILRDVFWNQRVQWLVKSQRWPMRILR
jgi:hypothetical protein